MRGILNVSYRRSITGHRCSTLPPPPTPSLLYSRPSLLLLCPPTRLLASSLAQETLRETPDPTSPVFPEYNPVARKIAPLRLDTARLPPPPPPPPPPHLLSPTGHANIEFLFSSLPSSLPLSPCRNMRIPVRAVLYEKRHTSEEKTFFPVCDIVYGVRWDEKADEICNTIFRIHLCNVSFLYWKNFLHIIKRT